MSRLNSRQKGARGEREWAGYLRRFGIRAIRGQQHSGSPDSPDVICNTPFHWEVKRSEQLRLYKALEQAVADSSHTRTPVVVHRSNGNEWVVILRADDFLRLMGYDDNA